MPKKGKAKKKATSKTTSSKKTSTSKKSVSTTVTQKRAPVNHFEIPFEDQKRVKDFYGSIFGWTFVDMPEMDYTMVHTTELDQNQMPTTPGAVNGGFTKRNPIQQQPTLVATVENIDKTSSMITESGGELLGEKLDVGMGFYQLFKDSEGNVLGIFESKPM